MLHDESATIPKRELHFTGEARFLVCPACDMPSFAACLPEEEDTRLFAHATEAA